VHLNGREQHRLRILMVATEGPPRHGGIARTVQYLQEGLSARGHQVEVLAYPDVKRWSMGEVRLSSMILRVPGILRRLSAYDILHIHGVTPTVSDVVFAAVRLLRRRPALIYTHHVELDFGGAGFLTRLYNDLHHRLSRLADETVCTAMGPLSRFQDGRSVSVIPLGVDVSRFAFMAKKSEPFTILYVGQFRPWKGVPLLMEATSEVHGARLVIAGSGPEEARYRALAERLGLEVAFHIGADDEVLRRLYRRAHVIVVPSTSGLEAFGLALLEGMSAGCVPIASNLPGVREVIGRVGFTFQAGAVEELAYHLRKLRDSPRLVEAIGERARARASQFKRERTVEDYENLFYDVLAVRQLRKELASGRDPSTLLDHFLQNLRARLGVHSVELVLQTANGDLVRRAAVNEVGDVASAPSTSALAGYAMAAKESVLLGGRLPPVLEDQLQGWRGGAMAAPLISGTSACGALIATRESSFDERDLVAWTRVAHQVASALVASGGSVRALLTGRTGDLLERQPDPDPRTNAVGEPS
jgi:glycosyltransferase involved in cell wall biosynthesis